MKRTIFIGVLAFFAVMTIASCGGNSGEGEGDAMDSVAIEEARIRDSIAKEEAWQKDSLEKAKLITADLSLFEVHGPVKKIVVQSKTNYGSTLTTTYEFDYNGLLIKLDGRNPFKFIDLETVHYERNEQGRISALHWYETGHFYIWEGEEGENKFTYDANGFISNDHYIYYDNMTHAILEESDSYYTYSKIDKYGNWTRRKGGDNSVKRDITYYQIERKK